MSDEDSLGGFSEQAVAAFRRLFDPANEPPPPEPRDGFARGSPAPGRVARQPAPPRGAEGERPHYWGHRQRVRDRFAAGGAASMPDYEIVEMLLFNAVPKRDVKPLAKKLLADFGGFERLLTGSREELARHPEVDSWIVHQLKLAEAVAIRLAKSRMVEKPVLGGLEAVATYCRTTMAHQRIETFRVLFLDAQHRLVADEELGRGTVNHTPAYPREVARRALELHASGVVLVHNHPSGDPTPSRQDVVMTRTMKAALALVSVALHDHLIIGAAGETSLAAEGLIE